MANEELKKKIVEIIQSVDFYDGLLYRYCIDIATADKLADALIAAGIVDKAARAERALENKCKNVCSACGMHQAANCKGKEFCQQEAFKRSLEQAEKELAEEEKK